MIEQKISTKLMGSLFELIITAKDKHAAEALLQEGLQEIKRIESLLTEFSTTSVTAQLNQHAGITPVEVPEEVYQLLKRTQHLSQLTQGSFDITVGPLKKLYNFKQQDFSFPGKKKIRDALQTVGYEYLQLLDNNRVYLSRTGMHISFAAIGKGYAADCVRKLWKEKNAEGGVINASGDLTVFGNRANGELWKIGISHPDNRNQIIFSIPMQHGATATSGDYEQFFMKNGIRYSHTIHPKTGLPLTGIKSVSIIHSSAELCDALATAVYVMGADAGIYFINQLPDTHAIVINSENSVFLSRHINIEDGAL